MLPNGLHPATAMDAGLGCRGRPAQRVAGGCQKDSYGDRYCLVRASYVREILPYPSTLVGYPIPLLSSSYPDTFKRKHDRPSYYLKFSANPLREHVKFLSRHTRWVAGSTELSAYRILQI